MPRTSALAQAILVTFLWSTSWVLIKIGLREEELDPVLFAGLRYTLAAALLLPLAWPSLRRARIDARSAGWIAALGLLFYTATQGAQFVALSLLPATAVNLALTSTPAVVLGLGVALGRERATALQVAGIGALLAGVLLYFGPFSLGANAGLGITVAALGTLANALSALLGRSLASDATRRAGGILPLTALSMAVGAVVLLAAGIARSGPPVISLEGWAIVAWLAVVNTAFAFTLWNHTLRTLTAVESSVINNTMLVQIAVLAWIFLGEELGLREIAGLAVAMAGVLVVQLAPLLSRRPALTEPPATDVR